MITDRGVASPMYNFILLLEPSSSPDPLADEYFEVRGVCRRTGTAASLAV